MKLHEIIAPTDAAYYHWNDFINYLEDNVTPEDIINHGWYGYYECWKAGFRAGGG